MEDFNEDDQVVLDNLIDSDGGKYEAVGNPLNTIGVIYGEDNAHAGRLLVKWSNGESNSYLPSNLKRITSQGDTHE